LSDGCTWMANSSRREECGDVTGFSLTKWSYHLELYTLRDLIPRKKDTGT
jgi:hypothetical protein